MKIMILAALAAGTTALAAPAAAQPTPAAQESAYTPGTYWEVQGIYIEDGQFENYMDFLADSYRRTQDYARSQGWITGYTILLNVNRRHDEPDLYLITQFPRLTTPQEDVERQRLMNEHLRQTTRQAAEQSGQRVRMRRLGSDVLLQELNLRRAR
jgi:hypothetical protein